jgi:hypothetical protein
MSITGLVVALASTVTLPIKPAVSQMIPGNIGQMIPGVNQALQSLERGGVSVKPTLEPSLRMIDDSFNSNNLHLCILPCGNNAVQPHPPMNLSRPQPNMAAPPSQPITAAQRTQQVSSGGPVGVMPMPSPLTQLPQQLLQQALQLPAALIPSSQPIVQQLLRLPQQLLVPAPIQSVPTGAPMAAPPMATPPTAAPVAASSVSPATVPGLPPAISSLIASNQITPTQLRQVVGTPQVQQFLATPQGQQFLTTPQGQNLVRMYQQSMMR